MIREKGFFSAVPGACYPSSHQTDRQENIPPKSGGVIRIQLNLDQPPFTRFLLSGKRIQRRVRIS